MVLLGFYETMNSESTTVAFVRFSALAAYLLLCITLLIGPLVTLWPKEFAQIVEPRRAIGIASFVFVLLHVFLSMAHYFSWDINGIFSVPPMAIGTVALILLFLLTITSCDFAIKKLGAVWWKRIQQFNYLAFILVTIHFVMKANGLFKGNSINLAEVSLIVLGAATVVLQIVGFVTRGRKNQKRSPSQTPPSNHNGS
ncbi:MAG: ferric reductase-like transmembrane domain-containing protein [Candidatus Micrarchaeota archaeon]